MSPGEVLEAVKKRGVKIKSRTLLNYEKLGLIPTPKRGSPYRQGKWTDYPENTVEAVLEAYIVIHNRDDLYWRQRALAAEEKLKECKCNG